MVNLIIWLMVGSLIGWLAGPVLSSGSRCDPLRNIILGIAGAMLGGWVLSPLFGAVSINAASVPQSEISLAGFVVAFLGAILVLVWVNLFRQSCLRLKSDRARL